MSQGISVQYCDPQGNARQLDGQFFPTGFAAVTLNAAAGTTPQPALVVPTGKYAFIVGLQITIDPICTIGSAGMINTTLTTVAGGQTAALLRSYIPAIAAAPTIPTVIRQTASPGAFFASTVPGDTFQVANSVALTAGSIRVSFGYGFTSVPIGNS